MLIIGDFGPYMVEPGRSNGYYLNSLDQLGSRFLLVVDNSRFICVLTDGDIRRKMLDGSDMNSAEDWMGKRSHHISVESTYAEALSAFTALKEEILPVLDEAGRVVFILTNRSLPPDHSGFILAGGLGSRLRPLTDTVPKPLLKLAGKPLINYVLENFRGTGVREIEISVNYLKEQFDTYFKSRKFGNSCNLELIHEAKKLGTAGSLKKSQSNSSRLLVSNADLVTDFDMNELIYDAASGGADIVIASRAYKHSIPFGVLDTEHKSVLKILEKPESEYLVAAGMYYMKREVFDLIEDDKPLDMPSLINQAVAEGFSVDHCLVTGNWIDIGRPDQLDLAKDMYE